MATDTSPSAPDQSEPTLHSTSPSVSLVLPAYNEEDRIAATLDLLIADAPAFRICEIVVVDDGSSDRTAELVTASARSATVPIRLIQLPANRGKGAAIRAGAAETIGDYVAFLDADLSATPSAIPRALESLQAGADVVIGTRISSEGIDFRRTQPRLRQLSGRVFVLLRRLLVGLPYQDTQCPFKVFTRDAARLVYPEVLTDGWAFDVELLARARKHQLTVVELPILWGHVTGSQLHVNPRTAFSVIRELLAIRIRVGRV